MGHIYLQHRFFIRIFSKKACFLKKIWYNERQLIFVALEKPVWGRGAAGSASEWHSEGRGFDPHRLHQ